MASGPSHRNRHGSAHQMSGKDEEGGVRTGFTTLKTASRGLPPGIFHPKQPCPFRFSPVSPWFGAQRAASSARHTASSGTTRAGSKSLTVRRERSSACSGFAAAICSSSATPLPGAESPAAAAAGHNRCSRGNWAAAPARVGSPGRPGPARRATARVARRVSGAGSAMLVAAHARLGALEQACFSQNAAPPAIGRAETSAAIARGPLTNARWCRACRWPTQPALRTPPEWAPSS